ncbi:hypothetical protein LJC33_00585 [Eubacteriales bacterium OttesenSCG-928-N13]|nr:hypothetical protein [Eubacteriales bacterium OttesenSCG-928-N13]
MTTLAKDILRVRLGAGDAVIARRERELAGFQAEYCKCLNPFRKELLRSEIKRQRRELEGLRRQLVEQHPTAQ